METKKKSKQILLKTGNNLNNHVLRTKKEIEYTQNSNSITAIVSSVAEITHEEHDNILLNDYIDFDKQPIEMEFITQQEFDPFLNSTTNRFD